jgi:hypothetical protein
VKGWPRRYGLRMRERGGQGRPPVEGFSLLRAATVPHHARLFTLSILLGPDEVVEFGRVQI